jgi:WD40 repeat protein
MIQSRSCILSARNFKEDLFIISVSKDDQRSSVSEESTLPFRPHDIFGTKQRYDMLENSVSTWKSRVLAFFDDPINDLDFGECQQNKDQFLCAVGGAESGFAFLSDIYGIKKEYLRNHELSVEQVEFSRDSSQIFTCSMDRTVSISDPNGENLWKMAGI